MNRQFKFRIWEPATKEMVYVDAVSIYTEDNLMEWTGLVDKNGKDIYEGDIVKHSGFYYLIANYDYYFEMEGIRVKESEFHPALNKRIQSALEVIGNIYQNPELLNTNDPTRELPDPI